MEEFGIPAIRRGWLLIFMIVRIKKKKNQKEKIIFYPKKSAPSAACPVRLGQGVYPLYEIKWVNNPSLNLGSNQVLLGGITLPLSAMSNNC